MDTWKPAPPEPPSRARSSTTMRLVRHARLGRCMYCLASGVTLSEEHLIPRSLGGRLTLRDAVCEPCRVSTGRLEQATLAREFIVPKTLLAFKRRRARGQGPRRLAPVELDTDGAAPAPPGAVELDPGAYPRSFALPAFEPAGLLVGTDRSSTPPRIDFVRCRLQLGTPTGAAAAAVRPLADPHAYAYALAKWAFGLAVAERGPDCCDTRAIRALLADQRRDAFNFVGTPQPRLPAVRERLHGATVRANGGWLTVLLDLFGSAGMPPYEVVIGALPPPA